MTVAVLINNYNNGPWLRAAVDSVFAQTRPPDEVIAYDDGSTDESISVLRSYGDRVRLIAGEHNFALGNRHCQALAVERAFAVSTAEHIHLLDGDDVFLPGKIAAFEAAWAARPEAVMIQCPMLRIDTAGRPLGPEREPRKHVPDQLAAIRRAQDSDLHYWTSALAFSRAFLSRTLPVDSDLSRPDTQALDTLLAAIAPLYGPVVTLDEALVLWRRLPKSTKSANRNTRLDNLRGRQARFNQHAARLGHPPLRAWRCPAFYRELLKSAGGTFLRRWLRAAASPKTGSP